MDYRSIIESKYNRESWQTLLHDIFKTGANFRTTPIVVDCNSPLAATALQLGVITLADDNKIAVYEIKLADNVDIVANRVGIRNLLINNWKIQGCVGAFMFCYRDNESVLRFSYVSSTFKFNDDGKMEKDETDTKRYTYLLGAGHRSRTAIKQFEDLRNSKLMLSDLTKAFSIEALSDRFFKEYKDNYENIIEYITGKRMVKVANKWEEKTMHAPNAAIMDEFSGFDDPEKAVRDYVKKLMGRIVFLQFIQKKGWLGVPNGKDWGDGDKEYLQNLYDRCQSKDNFIDGILELLFNDINTKRENDMANPILGHDIKVPYLNGGLFEQDKSDECTFRLPQKYLDDLFKFFSAYNFTIDENDPDDAEIGVDPEMLGRIFENLLEDNKDKGAFYTPKEIVQYMCRESLIAYLQTGEEDDLKDSIRTFVTTYDVSVLNDRLKSAIGQKLIDVKICDPAIGSGAFPMGLLKELFACRSAIEGLDNDNAAEIKKHIIQNNIYGVDIEKGAVDIARLRFWLTLIVDEKTPHALPNMDFKIVKGNSLYPTFDGKYVNLNDNQRHLNSSKIRDAKKELIELQSKFYESEGTLKQELLVRIKYLILEIVKLQMDYEFKLEVQNSANTLNLFEPQVKPANTIDEEKARIIGVCSRLQNQLSSAKSITERLSIDIPFFDWYIIFPDVFRETDEKEGFDIVIGNPPYISSATQMANDILAEQRGIISKIGKYKTIYQKWDLYIPFMELGVRYLCKDKGIFSMIVPYPVTNQIYAQKLREELISNNELIELVDLNGTKIFDNATVSNCIPFVQKNSKGESVVISHIDSDLVISKSFSQKYTILVQDKKSQIWKLNTEERLLDKYKSWTTLGDICYISKGMVLYSEDGLFTNEDLISETYDPIHCREYIEAKDMDTYAIKRVRYIEYNTKRVPALVSRPTFPELYTNPKLLFNCLGELKVSIDLDNQYICQQGIRVAVLWKNLKNVTNKSILSSIKRYSKMDREDMEKTSGYYDLRFLLGVLNSSFIARLYADIRGGDYHIVPEHIRQIPIPTISNDKQQNIINIVETIIEQKMADYNSDTSKYEKEIDSLVEALYTTN